MKQQFEDFARDKTHALLRSAYLLTGQRADAEDLVQVALFKLYKHWRRVTNADDPDAYMHRVLINEFLRTSRRSAQAHRELGHAASPGDAPSSRDLATEVATRVLLEAALRTLSPPERAAVVMHHVEGLPFAVVAEVMGIKESSARSAASRGTATLRDFFAHQMGQHEGEGYESGSTRRAPDCAS